MIVAVLFVGLLIAFNLFSLLKPHHSFTQWWSRPFRALFFRVLFFRTYHQGISYRHAWQAISTLDEIMLKERTEWEPKERTEWEPNEDYCWMHKSDDPEREYGGWGCTHPDCKKQVVEAEYSRKNRSPRLRLLQDVFLLLLMFILLVGYGLVALHITLHFSLFSH